MRTSAAVLLVAAERDSRGSPASDGSSVACVARRLPSRPAPAGTAVTATPGEIRIARIRRVSKPRGVGAVALARGTRGVVPPF